MKWISNLFNQVTDLFRRGDITEEFWENLEELLLQADAGVPATERLISRLREKVSRERMKDSEKFLDLFKEEIVNLLGGTTESLRWAASPPTVILMVGVNGVGKTTTIGKLAAQMRAHHKKVFLAAADTFRAAATDQLEIWAQRTGSELIKHREGADPAAVAFDAIKACQARGGDVVIVDTAGRLHTKSNLMEELKKIRRVIQKEIPEAPHETLLILDAVTGQNAFNQAKMFKEAAGVTGLIITKLDGSAKGGFILAIRQELNVPIKFVGMGEGMNDLHGFDPHAFAEGLLQ